MIVFVNLLPLKTGGGVQVALDFLNQASEFGRRHHWCIIAREGSIFEGVALKNHMELVHLVKEGTFSRLYFEYFGCKKLIRKYSPSVIYTQFGPNWPGATCIQVAGCAYSNLFYPELDFWGKLPFFQKLKKKLIDYVRLKRILSSDIRIFETKDLATRAKLQYSLKENEVFFVRSAVSSLVTRESYDSEAANRCKNLPAGFKVLLLSGYHPNKNIEFLIKTALHFKNRYPEKNVNFILTLPKENLTVIKLMNDVKSLGLEKHVYNFGSVSQQGCAELYRACQATVLPSRLESFSNMIAESWAMQRPLLISDLDWCQSLCGKGAVYYDYLNEDSLATKILKLKDDDGFVEAIVSNGCGELSNYPSARERFLAYMKIIENAVK